MEHLYSLYDALVSISVPGDRARQVVQAMERDMTGELATKTEVQAARTELFGAVERCRLELKADIDRLRQEMHAGFALLRSEMHAMSQQMTIKLGSMMVVLAGLIVTLQKLT